MNIPREAIEKAQQGGWDGEWDNSLGPVEHRGTENAVGWEAIALSAAFWQALGSVLEWDEESCIIYGESFCHIILDKADTAAFWKELLTN